MQDYFHDRIAQLVYTFPEDSLTSSGLPFWSAPKRCPKPLTFDAADASHASFIQVRFFVQRLPFCHANLFMRALSA